MTLAIIAAALLLGFALWGAWAVREYNRQTQQLQRDVRELQAARIVREREQPAGYDDEATSDD